MKYVYANGWKNRLKQQPSNNYQTKYKSGDGTVDEQIEYQSQAIEQDAEEYSRREVFMYYWSIDDLLKEQELAEDEQEM